MPIRFPRLVLVALFASFLGQRPSAQLAEEALLLATDTSDFDRLGQSAAIDGSTVVLGRPDDDTGSMMFHGSAFVYVEPQGGWGGTLTESARLLSPNQKTRGFFGSSVAVQGDLVVVGEKGFSGELDEQGALHVYQRPAGGWSGDLQPIATLVSNDTNAGAWLGNSVAIDGDTILGGAPFDDGGRGTAFVFVRPQGGWLGLTTQSAKIGLSGSVARGFGWSVDVSGPWIVVGAPTFFLVGSPQGRAYVLREPAGGWQGTIVPAGGSFLLQLTSGGPGDSFGFSVAIDGARLLVGAPGVDEAHVFGLPGWSQLSRLTPSNPIDRFGEAVAIDGPIVVVGATDLGFGGVGTTHVFREPAGGWSGPEEPSAELVTSVPSGTTSNYLGQSVGVDGHVVVSGAPSLEWQGVRGGGGTIHELEPARAVFRNGGTNPASLSASEPFLGGRLDVTVDLSTTGHTDAILFAFETPATVALGGGQTLLASDGGSGELLTGTGLMAPGPSATFSLPIPSTPAFLSSALSLQAVHAFGAAPFALSNACDLTIGF